MAKNMRVELELSAKDNASQTISEAAKAAEKSFKQTAQAAEQAGNAQAKALDKGAAAATASQKRIEQSYRAARKTASDVARARETLGVRSENAIQREINQTRQSYEQLKRSGVASQNELRRASEQTRQRVKALNAELGRSSFGDKAAGFGRGVMGVGAGVAAGAMVMREPARNQMDFDRQLAMVANTAFAERDVAGRIEGKKQLFDAVQKAVEVGGGTKEDALGSLDTLLASGAVSTETAINLLPALQKGAVATGASTQDMAQIAISAMQQFGIKEEDIGKVLDMAVAAGQAGNFELKDMARWLPQQMAAAKQAGLSGIGGLETLLIANQQARVTAGSSDEAGNNLVNLLAKITSKETNDRFKNLKYKDPKTGKTKGIDFAKSMEHYKMQGQDSLQSFMLIMDDVVGSDERYKALQAKLKTAKGEEQAKIFKELTDLVEGTAIGQIVSDRQALMALLGIKNNGVLGEEVKAQIAKSEGAVETSHAVVRDTNSYKTEDLKNTAEFAQMQNFEKVNNVLGELAQQLSDYGKAYPDLTQFLVGAKDAVFAFGAALAASSVMDLLTGKTKGLGGAAKKMFSKAAPSVASQGVKTAATAATTATATGAGAATSAGVGSASLATIAGVGLFFMGAANGRTASAAQTEAEQEKRDEMLKQYHLNNQPQKPSMFRYEGAPMVLNRPAPNYHGAHVIADRMRDDEVAQERAKQGTIDDKALQQRLDRNQQIIDNQIRPQVDAVSGALSHYQADFNAFGESLSAGIKAGLESQSHSLNNNIVLELDGRTLAEYVATEIFKFNKRMA